MSYTDLSSLFKGICDAIRAKDGTTDLIAHQDIPARISALSGSTGTIVESDDIHYVQGTYTNTSDADITTTRFPLYTNLEPENLDLSDYCIKIPHNLGYAPLFAWITLDGATSFNQTGTLLYASGKVIPLEKPFDAAPNLNIVSAFYVSNNHGTCRYVRSLNYSSYSPIFLADETYLYISHPGRVKFVFPKNLSYNWCCV